MSDDLSKFNESFFRSCSAYLPVADDFVRILYDVFQPDSVVDVGCGLGYYLESFEKLGVNIRGYEGSVHAIERSCATKGMVRQQDLRCPFSKCLSPMFDLCLCIEVVEHIHEKFAAFLVSEICRLSDKVFFTAAIKGQGGYDHVNEQPNDYWKELFGFQGFNFREDLVVKVKVQMDNKGLGKSNYRFYTNCMIFTRSE